jgi:low temperature requirement protein LtrA
VILISLFIKPYTLSFAVFFGGVLAAGLMPLLLRNVLKATPADLGNLSTRYSLLVLLIFGESIIGVAETIYAGLSLQAGLFFLVVILLFIAYQLVYDNGLDRRQKTAGLAVIYLQLPLLAAILSLSTFIHSWLAGLLDPQWFALAITVTLAVYYFSLIGYLSAYPVKHIDIGFKRWFYLGFSVLIFGIFSFMTTIMPLPFMFGLTAYLLANTLYLWQFILHPNDAMYNKLG